MKIILTVTMLLILGIGRYHTKQEVVYKARFCNNYCIIHIEQWGLGKYDSHFFFHKFYF